MRPWGSDSAFHAIPAPDRCSHRYSGRVEIVEAEHVDAIVVRRHSFAMEGIDAANAAEVMLRGERVELIQAQRFVAAQQTEPVFFVHFHHQRILAPADRAVARRRFRNVGVDFEGDGAAVATAANTFASAYPRVAAPLEQMRDCMPPPVCDGASRCDAVAVAPLLTPYHAPSEVPDGPTSRRQDGARYRR